VSDLVRVGVVGCGNVALNLHIPALQRHSDRFSVVGIADPTPDRLELGRTTAGLSAEQTLRDAHELIARQDVDLVDICSPNTCTARSSSRPRQPASTSYARSRWPRPRLMLSPPWRRSTPPA
jgi:hypothetical protein